MKSSTNTLGSITPRVVVLVLKFIHSDGVLSIFFGLRFLVFLSFSYLFLFFVFYYILIIQMSRTIFFELFNNEKKNYVVVITYPLAIIFASVYI